MGLASLFEHQQRAFWAGFWSQFKAVTTLGLSVLLELQQIASAAIH